MIQSALSSGTAIPVASTTHLGALPPVAHAGTIDLSTATLPGLESLGGGNLISSAVSLGTLAFIVGATVALFRRLWNWAFS